MTGKGPLKGERGSVVVLVLIMLALVTIMGVAASTTSTIEVQIAGNEQSHKRAFYSAEAGIEHAKAVLSDRFAVANAQKISMGIAPDWDFALYGPDEVSTLDDATDTTFDGGAVWLNQVPLDAFTYTVTVWNNPGDAGGVTDDADALIWVRSEALGPGEARGKIQVTFLGTASGGVITGYTGQAGSGEGKTFVSNDVNAISTFSSQL